MQNESKRRWGSTYNIAVGDFQCSILEDSICELSDAMLLQRIRRNYYLTNLLVTIIGLVGGWALSFLILRFSLNLPIPYCFTNALIGSGCSGMVTAHLMFRADILNIRKYFAEFQRRNPDYKYTIMETIKSYKNIVDDFDGKQN